MSRFAQFRQNDSAYNQYLDSEDGVFLPPEITSGECTITLYGNKNNTIAITEPLTLYMADNIFISDSQSTKITKSLYEQLSEKVKQLEDNGISNDAIKEVIIEYLQENPIGGMTLTPESIKNALGYVPADADDVALLLHKCAEITSMTVSPSVAELGSNVTATVNVQTSKEAKKIVITRGNTEIHAVENAQRASCNVSEITSNTPASITFRATATDDLGHESSKTVSISFYNGVYSGVGDESTVISNLAKSLQSGRGKTFTVSAGNGQYVWYACPARLGTPTFKVGGFDGGFDLVRTENYTNLSGYTESYQVWKSSNANLGTITVIVS